LGGGGLAARGGAPPPQHTPSSSPGRPHTLHRHHRAAPVSAFTRVFDALWARDPVIQHFTKKMDRPLSRAMTGSGLGDDGGMR
jgi:hypothetical protein